MPAEAEQRAVMAVVEDLEGALVASRGKLGEPGVVQLRQPERSAPRRVFRIVGALAVINSLLPERLEASAGCRRPPAKPANGAAAEDPPRRCSVRRAQRDGARSVIRDCFVRLFPAASRAVTTAVTVSRRFPASAVRVAFDSLSVNVRVVEPDTVSVLRAIHLPPRFSFTVTRHRTSPCGHETRTAAMPRLETRTVRLTRTFGAVTSAPALGVEGLPPAGASASAGVTANVRVAEPTLPLRPSPHDDRVGAGREVPEHRWAGAARERGAVQLALDIGSVIGAERHVAVPPLTATAPTVTAGACVSTLNVLVAEPDVAVRVRCLHHDRVRAVREAAELGRVRAGDERRAVQLALDRCRCVI